MALSKKIRFEVFKRDSFTCQYCGRSAPDVVLQADHIKPVAAGGEDDIINLITSCFDCNSGKCDRELSDDTVVSKRLNQTRTLQDRREQIEMMLEWHDSLKDQNEDLVDEICSRLSEAMGQQYSINESGRSNIKRWVKKFNLLDILEAIDTSAAQYLRLDEEARYIKESTQKFFDYIPKIIANKKRMAERPYLKDLYYIRGILRNRLSYLNEHLAIRLMEDNFKCGKTVDEIKQVALDVKSWSAFRDTMEQWLAEVESPW